MGRAKEISLKVIPGKVANPFMRRHHYSGTVVNNSCLHFGVFLDGRLHGVMSNGPSLNKSKILPLVAGTGWNEYLKLNRMAFDSVLPRNSESRAISLSIKLQKVCTPCQVDHQLCRRLFLRRRGDLPGQQFYPDRH